MNYIDENDYIISCAYNSIGREEMKNFFFADFWGIITTVIDSAEARIGKTIDPVSYTHLTLPTMAVV